MKYRRLGKTNFQVSEVSLGTWQIGGSWGSKRAIPGIHRHYPHLMKHLSRFVKPGAKRLDIMSLTGYENLLVFANPDESVGIMTQNDLCQELPVRVKVGDKVIASTLEADSFNTFVVRH